MRRLIGRVLVLSVLLSGSGPLGAHLSRAASASSPWSLTGKLLWSYDTGG